MCGDKVRNKYRSICDMSGVAFTLFVDVFLLVVVYEIILTFYISPLVNRWYRPPELMFGKKEYGPEIDMWAVGCIFAQLMLRKPLWEGNVRDLVSVLI